MKGNEKRGREKEEEMQKVKYKKETEKEKEGQKRTEKHDGESCRLLLYRDINILKILK